MMTAAGRKALEELRKAEELGQLELPWEGRSPRDLTRAAAQFRLKAQDDDVEALSEDERLDEQCRRHFHGS